jgi:hypothetical protein
VVTQYPLNALVFNGYAVLARHISIAGGGGVEATLLSGGLRLLGMLI